MKPTKISGPAAPSPAASPVSRSEVEDAELRLLRFLCRRQREGSARSALFELLQQHRFVSMFHQVLFDCLQGLPARRHDLPDITERLLAERLVRAGFPDFDLQPYLSGAMVSSTEADALGRRLQSGGADVSR